MYINQPTDADHCDPCQCDPQVDRPFCPLPNLPLSNLDSPGFSLKSLFASFTEEQTRLRTFLLGHPNDVRMEILRLHHCGYDVQLWSRPQAIPGTPEVISVYTKRSRRADF